MSNNSGTRRIVAPSRNMGKTRPKYPTKQVCTFLRPEERAIIEQKARAEIISPEEKSKVNATKQYFRQYWTNSIRYRKDRHKRQQEVNKICASESWSEAEIAKYKQDHLEKENLLLRRKRLRMSKNDFELLAILGKGGFGEVYLSRKRDTGEILALKKIPKARFVQQNDVSKLRLEKEVMTQHDSVWLIKMRYSFQSETHVFLAMDYIPGGDIKNLLDHVGCFSEEHALFYFAEMLLAVDALHELGYIHRDLKPDNFMVTATGHIMLIDFGLSKEGHKHNADSFNFSLRYQSARSFQGSLKKQEHSTRDVKEIRKARRKFYSVVGSPEYMALEILEETGYTELADYWSLGVIFFELCFGVTPFDSETVEETFLKIACWEDYLVTPDCAMDEEPLSSETWDLIRGLLCESESRLGKNDISEIQNCACFSEIDWDMLKTQKIIPPFIPELHDLMDPSYFSSALTTEDYATLEIDKEGIREILGANLQDPESFPDRLKELANEESTDEEPEKTPLSATYYKNTAHASAFAGITYKHEEMDILLKAVNGSSKTK
eukprot:TRINITY_DN6816_c0_g1_i1.p1 TRINITY_DN6816_c0_g1~~TRINITY_DN6816_c0_g1_i1.p1  ORF type:complete len:550 (-),score=83.23 TRINITY_DN6816_c0_g1_i1:77-1726(-)